MTEHYLGNTLENSEEFPRSFQTQFRGHLRVGTRPEGPPRRPSVPWTPATFHTALAAAMKSRRDSGVPPTRRAVSNWFAKDSLPRERFIEPIMDVLFGTEARQAGARAELLRLWQHARAMGQPVEADVEDAESTQYSARERWTVTRENAGPGLADLRIQMPPSENDPGTFLLQVSLSLARWPDEIEGFRVEFGLKSAHLAPDWTNCQPAELPALENVVERGGVFHVTGPRSDDAALLDGHPLQTTTLAVMERTNPAPSAVTLSLRSRRRDLEMVADDNISTNKEAVLRVFLQECQIENETRFVTWSTATLTEKSVS